MVTEYKITLTVEDSVEKFKDESGNLSGDVDLIPEDIMIVHIKKAVGRFSDFKLNGVSIKDVKLEMKLDEV